MKAYTDTNSEGNSTKYHTGKLCINGCGRPAGTAWGLHWCVDCNIKRLDGVLKSLHSILNDLQP